MFAAESGLDDGESKVGADSTNVPVEDADSSDESEGSYIRSVPAPSVSVALHFDVSICMQNLIGDQPIICQLQGTMSIPEEFSKPFAHEFNECCPLCNLQQWRSFSTAC